ncbi:HAD-like domain-containing protein [Cynara cardunculus var. scolymus]|uniref:HAD-like domain-containing protein n=1 Tax=Cynara cardunculus var. scolymus TaxID=59895 RepID=A0A118JV70_CYNCS|nr:HAD-like domain-containing protein [Cynara cardunculus var. scolymus]
MALKLLANPLHSASSSQSQSKIPTLLRSFRSFHKHSFLLQWRSKVIVSGISSSGLMVRATVKEDMNVVEKGGSDWGKVSAVLFDMDGVLCNSEESSRLAAVDVFAEMGVQVTVEDFVPFMGTGEANFLGGVASVKGVSDFNPEAAKKRFFEIYLDKYAKPNSGIGFPGALELITQCKNSGLKVAVASSADRIKVDANLAAAGLSLTMFDAIVSADAFENLKPAPDIFIAASKILNVPPSECIVIEDALAGVQAAKAAQMRSIAVTTTLSEDALKEAEPSLIRKDIGNISLQDILGGGSSYRNTKIQGSQSVKNPAETSSVLKRNTEGGSFQEAYSTNDSVFSVGGLQGSRRQILRYGSLGIALSCLYFTFSNLKAMQYASPKAIWNLLFKGNSPPFGQSEDATRSSRIQQFINYISDVESKGSTTIVPEFPAKLDWLNTTPLQLRRDLKGKVVLLDFWTYCCINCMHVLPDLEFLEKKYKDMPFTVVGVHSAKFDNEKDLEAIRNAVLRYGITHPVVNDGDMYMWRELGINSWPTFAIIGPTGKLLAQLAGEGRRKDLDDLVEAALIFYGRRKSLDTTPIPLSLEKDNDPRLLKSPLKFPGKLAVDVFNKRLFISDSNHNRIVVTDLDGNFLVQVGSSGEEGLRDGNFDTAMFNRPQGLAYNATKNLLYVADTENHALRVIDFVNELLNSPWDVCFEPVNQTVYIAMAGQHQIWEHSTLDGVTKAFSGDGYERNLNGSSSSTTSFAQPSGLSLSQDVKEAYIADSESSSIRALNLTTGGSRLLVGGDPIMTELALKCFFNTRWASYVERMIKKLDPATKKVSTLAGTGKAGFKDGAASSAQLSEPAGIVEADQGRLFIADTNNSLIRYLDLNKENAELVTLELKGVQPPAPKSRSPRRLRRRTSADTETIVVDGVSSNEGNLILSISVPEGYHFSNEARSKFSVEIEPEDAAVVDPLDGNLSPDGTAILHFRRSAPSATLSRVNCKVYYCKEDEVCLYQSLVFEVPFREVSAEIKAPQEIKLPFVVKPKSSEGSLQLPVAQ